MINQIFTPVSLLKKVFRLGERSLAREEVSHRLQYLNNGLSIDSDKVIQAALESNSPFGEGSSRAIIEFRQQSISLASDVIQMIQKLGAPITEQQLLRKLRSKNKISWSFSFERLGLIADHRFVQLTDGRWMLTEWDVVNEEVYRQLTKQGVTELSRREIPLLLEVKLGMKNKGLFLPELDERFEIDETTVYIIDEQAKKDEQAEKEQEAINESFTEVAATMSQTTVLESKREAVVDEVLEDLTSALVKLEQRANEMKEEVVNHFSSNNLDAIKALMNEKEKSEKVLGKLKVLVDELT